MWLEFEGDSGLSSTGLASRRGVEGTREVTGVSARGVGGVSGTVLFGIREGRGAMSSEAEGAG